jgi:integrase
MSAKARSEKAALTRFVQFYNDRPQTFQFNASISQQPKYDHVQWGREEFLHIMSFVHRKYRPIFQLGVMSGQGRKELVYLNNHIDEVKDVSEVKGAVMLDGMPPRKPKGSGKQRKWIAIYPKQEFNEFKKTAPIKKQLRDPITKVHEPITVGELTDAFAAALKRAGPEYDVLGTGSHVLRSIFETCGLSQPPGGVNVDERYLNQNMGHASRDGMQYDQTAKRLMNVQERARALIPLWDFFRNGPKVASSTQLEEMKEEYDRKIAGLQKEHTELVERIQSGGHVYISKDENTIAFRATRQEVVEAEKKVAEREKVIAELKAQLKTKPRSKKR